MALPDLNGLDVYEKMGAHQKGLKVIIASGYSSDLEKISAMLSANVEYIAKPYSPGMLVSRIKTVLGRPSFQ